MSIQPIFANSKVHEKAEQPIGCWQRFKDGIGSVVSTVIWIVSAIGKIVLWPIQIISTFAFKALSVIWPGAENFWQSLLLIGERVISAAREEELLQEIEMLQIEARNLREEIGAQEIKIEAFRVKGDSLVWELDVVQKERDTAQKERDQRLVGRIRLRKEIDELEAALAALTQDKEQQEKELAHARQEIEVLNGQLAQGNRNGELLEQFRKIDAAYENRMVEQNLNATELELQKLVPIYEKQKEAYNQMIQSALKQMPRESELQTLFQGVLGLVHEQAEHLKQISKEIHFYAELKIPLNCLRKAIIAEFL